MNGPHRTGQEYAGKHRRDNVLPSVWAGRAESYGRPVPLAAQIMVNAKEPVPGRVKTRLTPPYTPAQAAGLAAAALTDTLAAVASADVTRRATGARATAASVSVSDASARAAACAGV